MTTFTLRHDGRKHRVRLVSLYPADHAPDADRRESYHVGCGIYTPDPHDRDRLEWTGMSVNGDIPVPELVRWGLRKGYLKWERTDWVRNPEGGER